MIAEKLKELRKNQKQKLTQEQVAKALGIDRSTYTYYELGKNRPDIDMLKKIAKLFNCSYVDLLDDEEQILAADSNNSSESDAIILTKKEQEIMSELKFLSSKKKAEVLDYIKKIKDENKT